MLHPLFEKPDRTLTQSLLALYRYIIEYKLHVILQLALSANLTDTVNSAEIGRFPFIIPNDHSTRTTATSVGTSIRMTVTVLESDRFLLAPPAIPDDRHHRDQDELGHDEYYPRPSEAVVLAFLLDHEDREMIDHEGHLP